MIISRSRMVASLFPVLVIDSTAEEIIVFELNIMGVILDTKLTFTASVSRRVFIFGKTMSVFRVVIKYFWALILPLLKHCSPVWMSVATSYLLWTDCVVGRVSQLNFGSVSCGFWHIRTVAFLCIFFLIYSLVGEPIRAFSFSCTVCDAETNIGGLAVRSLSLQISRSRTGQFSRSIVLACVRLWNNRLHESVFVGEGLRALNFNQSFFKD